jgi:D-sedoheptulose 7-phosphate isomerase
MNTILDDLVSRYPSLTACADSTQAALDLLIDAFSHRGKVLLCGNGGSAADCDHIVGELMKSFLLKRPLPAAHRDALRRSGDDAMADALQCGFPCVALTAHTALNTAVANDVSADLVFAQQAYVLGQAGDVLWGLSTSGNSRNVVNAFTVARAIGLRTLAFTGQGGGKLAQLADVAVRVPAVCTPDIQELHLPVYHALCAAVEAHFFGGNASAH